MPVCSTTSVVDKIHLNLKDSVGLPIGPCLRIVNDQGDALPYGQEGEIVLSGPGVIKSYLGLDNKATHFDQVWLKTGDIGMMDEKGNVFHKGRLKEMVKRGGEQVNLLEVRAHITASIPSI